MWHFRVVLPRLLADSCHSEVIGMLHCRKKKFGVWKKQQVHGETIIKEITMAS